MDASDTTRKRKTTVIYINQLNTFAQNNTGGDCLVSTCCYTTSSCIKTFESYDNKYEYYAGLNNCRECPNPYPENGGNR